MIPCELYFQVHLIVINNDIDDLFKIVRQQKQT